MDKEKAKLIESLQRYKKQAERKAKIDKLLLFGSRARDKASKTSDVDLLLISNSFKGKKYFKRASKFYYLWDLPYNVDIICLTPEEVMEKKKQAGVIQEAIKEGIEI